MGTKSDPGAFDCHAAALPDEEMFVLLARDRLAPGLTRLWAAIRAGDRHIAFAAMTELQAFVPHYELTPDVDKADEAFAVSEAMRHWRSKNPGAWRQPSASNQEIENV